MQIAKFKYTYGAGSQPNRLISFERDGQNPKSIHAKVSAYINGKILSIGDIPGGEILIEPLSTSERILLLEEYRRTGKKPSIPPDRAISDITIKEQDAILTNLSPRGSWNVTIQNHLSQDPRVEKVIQLTLFNAN